MQLWATSNGESFHVWPDSWSGPWNNSCCCQVSTILCDFTWGRISQNMCIKGQNNNSIYSGINILLCSVPFLLMKMTMTKAVLAPGPCVQRHQRRSGQSEYREGKRPGTPHPFSCWHRAQRESCQRCKPSWHKDVNHDTEKRGPHTLQNKHVQKLRIKIIQNHLRWDGKSHPVLYHGYLIINPESKGSTHTSEHPKLSWNHHTNPRVHLFCCSNCQVAWPPSILLSLFASCLLQPPAGLEISLAVTHEGLLRMYLRCSLPKLALKNGDQYLCLGVMCPLESQGIQLWNLHFLSQPAQCMHLRQMNQLVTNLSDLGVSVFYLPQETQASLI